MLAGTENAVDVTLSWEDLWPRPYGWLRIGSARKRAVTELLHKIETVIATVWSDELPAAHHAKARRHAGAGVRAAVRILTVEELH